MLQSPSDFSAFQNAVRADPTLGVDAKRESQVIRDQYKRFNDILYFVSYIVGTVMALGATLGAANSLYAIVDDRRRELATLRASDLGLGRSSLPCSWSRNYWRCRAPSSVPVSVGCSSMAFRRARSDSRFIWLLPRRF